MTKHLKKFENHSQFESFIKSGQRILHNVSYCKQEDHVHYDDYGVQPSSYEYVDLGLPSGTLWAKDNLGATESNIYGDIFAWGEVTNRTSQIDCEEYKFAQNCTEPERCSKYNYTDNKDFLDLEDDAAHVIMGDNWKIPYPSHFTELFSDQNTTKRLETVMVGNDWHTFLILTSTRNSNQLVFPLYYFGVVKSESTLYRIFYWTGENYKGNNNLDYFAQGLSLVCYPPNSVNWELFFDVKWLLFHIRPIIPSNNVLT